jgi:hypothetical protein
MRLVPHQAFTHQGAAQGDQSRLLQGRREQDRQIRVLGGLRSVGLDGFTHVVQPRRRHHVSSSSIIADINNLVYTSDTNDDDEFDAAGKARLKKTTSEVAVQWPSSG